MKIDFRLWTVVACLVLGTPAFGPVAIAADDFSVAQAGESTSEPNGTTSEPAAGSSFNQCKPACVAPEICCKLSGLEAACLPKDDCFAKKGRLLRPD